jgi:hypothetical protein
VRGWGRRAPPQRQTVQSPAGTAPLVGSPLRNLRRDWTIKIFLCMPARSGQLLWVGLVPVRGLVPASSNGRALPAQPLTHQDDECLRASAARAASAES